MTHYNMSAVESARNAPEIIKAANDLTGGTWAYVVLMIMGVITVVYFRDKDLRAVFIGTSFFITVVGISMYFTQLISWKMLVFPIIMLMVSLIFFFVTKDD